jgi:dihydroorotase
MLTDEDCMHFNPVTKVNPPLRSTEDQAALRLALSDGTIDAVATDHAPHSSVEKQVEFDCAAFGAIGFETALSIVLSLVTAKEISLMSALERLTWGPARTLRLPGGFLQEGLPADLVCIDLEKKWVAQPHHSRSKSINSPFLGRQFQGKAVMTFVGGRLIHDERS